MISLSILSVLTDTYLCKVIENLQVLLNV